MPPSLAAIPTSSNESAVAKQCDLCGQRVFTPIAQHDRHGAPLTTEICQRCGLVSHGQIPSEQELKRFYADDYRLRYHGEYSPSPRRVLRAWKNGRRIADQLRPYLRSSDRVLEVGAGIGCTVRCLSDRGLDASGIEPNLGFQQFAERQLAAPVQRATLEQVTQPGSYQALLLVHVIEHLRSPSAALRHLHRVLAGSGYLYIECPNLAAPFATRRRLFHYAHIHNFTPMTLQWMAERCGFRLVSSFGSQSHPNLQMLFRKTECPTAPTIPADAADRTLRDAFRYSTATYHLRPTYMLRRLQQLGAYMHEHLVADRAVGRLVGTRRAATSQPLGSRDQVAAPPRPSVPQRNKLHDDGRLAAATATLECWSPLTLIHGSR